MFKKSFNIKHSSEPEEEKSIFIDKNKINSLIEENEDDEITSDKEMIKKKHKMFAELFKLTLGKKGDTEGALDQARRTIKSSGIELTERNVEIFSIGFQMAMMAQTGEENSDRSNKGDSKLTVPLLMAATIAALLEELKDQK